MSRACWPNWPGTAVKDRKAGDVVAAAKGGVALWQQGGMWWACTMCRGTGKPEWPWRRQQVAVGAGWVWVDLALLQWIWEAVASGLWNAS